jgi:hypothetical protein
MKVWWRGGGEEWERFLRRTVGITEKGRWMAEMTREDEFPLKA